MVKYYQYWWDPGGGEVLHVMRLFYTSIQEERIRTILSKPFRVPIPNYNGEMMKLSFIARLPFLILK